MLSVNGINIHAAELGEGPLVLLCHGWPELWYSWRHQLPALAAAGFRAVAIDMRGYGETDAPADVSAYNILQLVGDTVGVVAALGEERAIMVGHDWGATVAWASAQLRPDVFYAVAGLSVPHRGRGPADPIAMLRASGSENYYWMYFQEPGVAEAELERDVTMSIRKVLYGASGDSPTAGSLGNVPAGRGFLDQRDDPTELPAWLTKEDIAVYAAAFTRTGFRGGLNWYRNLSLNWELQSPWQGAKITQPALFIAGSRDPMIVGKRGLASLANMQRVVPGVQSSILEGAGHWIQQERPNEVNAALVAFAKSVAT